MPITNKPILLILLSLHSFVVFSQNQDFFSDSIRARDLNRVANNLGRNGMHLQALDTFFYGLNLREKIYGEENYNLAAVYSGIGITYRALGNNDLALKNFNQAEKNYLQRSNYRKSSVRHLYVNIGNVYRSKLDFVKALQYYKQALSIFYQEKEPDLSEIAEVNYNIADIYYIVNNYRKALEIIKTNIDNAYIEDQILFYELYAFINQIKGNKTKAKKNYLIAINLAIEVYEDNSIDIAYEYLNYALFLISIDDFIESDNALEKAFDIIKLSQPNHGIGLAIYYKIKGELSRNISIETRDITSFSKQKKQKLNQAISWYFKGLQALNFPDSYSQKSINKSANWLSLMDCIFLLKEIADTHKEIADISTSNQTLESLTNAIKNYQIAGSLIQKARKEISSDESKIQLTELEHSTFQKLIQTAFDAYSITSKTEFIKLAFQSAERIKSSSVFDKISEQAALDNSLIPDSLIQLERKINSTISIFSEKLFEENNENIPDTLLTNDYNNKIFEATRQREELNQFLETEFSDYYDLKYSGSMLSIFDIQQKLTGDEIIIEYVLNETDSISELYTFLIAKNKLNFNKLEVNADFSQSIEKMFHFMSNPEYMLTTKSESKIFCKSAHQLYKKLILPSFDDIQNKNITIIPDGKLSYIPFDALLEELPDTTIPIKFNQLKYLIRNYNINYSNSSNLLFKHKSPSKRFKNKAIAFAPEYQYDTVEFANQTYTLFPLPGVQTEVDVISKTITTKIFRGDEASETNFRKYIEDYDILHLAMHAFINDSLPSFSRLAFAPDTSKNIISDGWINTTDIYNLKLSARLTVLSACNTGIGQLRKGEGLLSLARGFFYAGCPSIIMSLWEVEDQSGTQIMGSFYKNLKKGKSKSEALRMAKLEYLENANSRRAHPHYWLGYVSYGDDSPLYKSYDFYFFSLLIFVLAGIMIDQLYRIKKARKQRAS